MYNEHIKQRFINDYTENENTVIGCTRILNRIESIEQDYSKDIYFLSYEKIAQEILKQTRIASYTSFYQYILILKQYKQWCMLNNVFSESNYFPVYNISDIELRKIYAEYINEAIFRSIDELHEYIDEFYDIDIDNSNMQKQDYMKTFILLLYHGIHEDDIFTLTTENIKEQPDGVYIIYRNRIVKIIDEETKALLQKRKKSSQYEIDRGRWTEYADLPNLLITYGGDDTSYNQAQTKKELARYTRIYNKENNDNRKIQFFNIYVSGLINQIKENGKDISTKELYEIFEENGYPEDVATRGKKKIIKEIYKVW